MTFANAPLGPTKVRSPSSPSSAGAKKDNRRGASSSKEDNRRGAMITNSRGELSAIASTSKAPSAPAKQIVGSDLAAPVAEERSDLALVHLSGSVQGTASTSSNGEIANNGSRPIASASEATNPRTESEPLAPAKKQSSEPERALPSAGVSHIERESSNTSTTAVVARQHESSAQDQTTGSKVPSFCEPLKQKSSQSLAASISPRQPHGTSHRGSNQLRSTLSDLQITIKNESPSKSDEKHTPSRRLSSETRLHLDELYRKFAKVEPSNASGSSSASDLLPAHRGSVPGGACGASAPGASAFAPPTDTPLGSSPPGAQVDAARRDSTRELAPGATGTRATHREAVPPPLESLSSAPRRAVSSASSAHTKRQKPHSHYPLQRGHGHKSHKPKHRRPHALPQTREGCLLAIKDREQRYAMFVEKQRAHEGKCREDIARFRAAIANSERDLRKIQSKTQSTTQWHHHNIDALKARVAELDAEDAAREADALDGGAVSPDMSPKLEDSDHKEDVSAVAPKSSESKEAASEAPKEQEVRYSCVDPTIFYHSHACY